MVKSLAKYAEVTVLPIHLSVDHRLSEGIYSFNQVRESVIAQSPFDADTLTAAIVILSLLGIAAYFLNRRPIISFGISWFFIALLPVMNVIPMSALMRERYLYLPSYGFCLAVAAAVAWASEAASARRQKAIWLAVMAAYSLLLLSFVALSMGRNMDWRDGMSLWSASVSAEPGSAYAHYNLGVEYDLAGSYDKASREYVLALEADPYHSGAYLNLGVYYERQGRFNEAFALYRKAADLNPTDSKAHYDLGVRYHAMGKVDEAAKEYLLACSLKPRLPMAHYNLGNIHLIRGEYPEALVQYNLSVQSKDPMPSAYVNMGVAYYELGLLNESADSYLKALVIQPGSQQTHANLGNTLLKMGKIEEAKKEYAAAGLPAGGSRPQQGP
jgi:protein O-mannosyl-transferase